MTNAITVRAWKDAEFRATLAPGAVPAHPAGTGEVRRKWLEAESATVPTTKSVVCSCHSRCP